MNFKRYQSQINELIALRKEPDFTDLFNKILFGESNSDKFLIKMEITRLAKPCQRIIDLRDKVIDECELFQHKAIKHYLTAHSIKVFQENVALYGMYTIGVFEAVYEDLAQQKEKQNKKIIVDDTAKNEQQCEFLHLSQQSKNFAPRMFFVSAVEILLPSGQAFKGQTSNISSTGVKIRLLENIGHIDQQYVDILFTDLRQQYQESVLNSRIKYQIVKHSNEDNVQFLYLTYADQQQLFITFIRNFIRLNQYRYKIDVNYYYQVAKTTALKNMYLAQMSPLPIYLDCSASTPFLFALNNQSNERIINEWICEGINQLPVLFDELRLTRLIANASKYPTTTLYCFIHHTNGKDYFLSACEEELIEKGLKDLFINFGSIKKSWKVYQLTLHSYQYQQSQSYDITEPLPPEFEKITHIATIQKILSPSFNIKSKIDKAQLNDLNQFVHSVGRENETAIFSLFSSEHRKEERYIHNSKLSLSTEDAQYTGELLDFSLSGLKIKLDQIASFAISSKVTVNLVELQKVSKRFSLSDLQYKVVGSGANNTLHLQVCDPLTLKICNQFFSLLVQNNRKHLQCLPLQSIKQPPSKRLQEVSEAAFNDCIFFVAKESGRPKIKIAAIDQIGHPLQKLFSMYSDNSSELNYYPLENNHLYERLLAQPYKKNETGLLFKEALIYIKASKDKDNKWLINSFLDSDFKSNQQAVEFIMQADKEATFFALQYRLVPLEPVDFNVIKSEIQAISRFAIHLTKKLEEELLAINAMIEVTDRTHSILLATNEVNLNV